MKGSTTHHKTTTRRTASRSDSLCGFPFRLLYFQSLRMLTFFWSSFFITLATAISKSSCEAQKQRGDRLSNTHR